jgi:hypothetical protein
MSQYHDDCKAGKREPTMSIHGIRLNAAQAMTVRVAVMSFAASLAADGLGDDEQGKALAEAYGARIAEILRIFDDPIGVFDEIIAKAQAKIDSTTPRVAT